MTAVDPQLRATRTTCAYCGVGCGILATPDGRGGAAISGDPDHPANFGRLCSKGSALGETLGLEDRLLYPMIRCDKGTLERVAWSDALDHVAHRFQHIIARDGPGAVAFYLSGQLLTEDYYVANKLMKGFIGSANVDTNSRLCMASSVAGHRRAFGADTVPGCYEDLDQADLLVLVGSNAAWCHPVLFQRMLANKQQRGARIVVIDPRRSPDCWRILPTMARSTAITSIVTPPVSTTPSRAPGAWPAACARRRWRPACRKPTSLRSSRCLPIRRAW
jgi:assimilatory nitrate reductase catalytic subunit